MNANSGMDGSGTVNGRGSARGVGRAGGRSTRVMPSAATEAVLGRTAWWALWSVNVILAAITTVMAIGVFATDPHGSGAAHAVLAFAALLWWALVGMLFVLVLHRPHPSPPSIDGYTAAGPITGHAGSTSTGTPAGPTSTGTPAGVTIVGNRRVPGWQFVVLIALIALCVAAAVASSGGWRIVAIVIAVMALAGAIRTVLVLRHRPRLVLTPQGFDVTGARGDARVAWEDVTMVAYVQSSGGLMAARVDIAPQSPGKQRRIDVAPLTFDLDPLLLVLALRLYWLAPKARMELAATAAAPARLFDGAMATASTPPEISDGLLSTFRPR